MPRIGEVGVVRPALVAAAVSIAACLSWGCRSDRVGTASPPAIPTGGSGGGTAPGSGGGAGASEVGGPGGGGGSGGAGAGSGGEPTTGGATGASGGRGSASGGTSGTAGGTGGTAGRAGSAGGQNGGQGGGSFVGSTVAAGVRWFGRVDTTDPASPRFAWSGTGFVARFTGTSLGVRLSNAGAFVFKAIVDGTPQAAFVAAAGQATYSLAAALGPGAHTVALYRQTEGVYGDSQFLGLTVGGGALMEPPAASGRLIEVVGASVSCGYGDLGTDPCAFSFATESHFDSYASVAARATSAELSTVAISGRGVYRNTDGTTEGTMPKLFDRILAGSAAPVWDFRATPQVVVINLGRNDFTLGDPGLAFREAYLAFTRALRTRYPGALIVCTTGPNLGAANHALQVAHVNAVIATRHAEGDPDIELLDWPEQIAGEIGCEFHPNAAKHLSMGNALAALLRARLGW